MNRGRANWQEILGWRGIERKALDRSGDWGPPLDTAPLPGVVRCARSVWRRPPGPPLKIQPAEIEGECATNRREKTREIPRGASLPASHAGAGRARGPQGAAARLGVGERSPAKLIAPPATWRQARATRPVIAARRAATSAEGSPPGAGRDRAGAASERTVSRRPPASVALAAGRHRAGSGRRPLGPLGREQAARRAAGGRRGGAKAAARRSGGGRGGGLARANEGAGELAIHERRDAVRIEAGGRRKRPRAFCARPRSKSPYPPSFPDRGLGSSLRADGREARLGARHAVARRGRPAAAKVAPRSVWRRRGGSGEGEEALQLLDRRGDFARRGAAEAEDKALAASAAERGGRERPQP